MLWRYFDYYFSFLSLYLGLWHANHSFTNAEKYIFTYLLVISKLALTFKWRHYKAKIGLNWVEEVALSRWTVLCSMHHRSTVNMLKRSPSPSSSWKSQKRSNADFCPLLGQKQHLWEKSITHKKRLLSNNNMLKKRCSQRWENWESWRQSELYSARDGWVRTETVW